MFSIRECLFSAMVAALVTAGAIATSAVQPAAASEIKYVVNGVAVTSYDIQRRAAFLKLQHRKGDLNKLASDEMVDQALRKAEIKRLGISIPDQQVDEAFAKFAKTNKLNPSQMSEILQKAGVGADHFKDFMRTQMGWNKALSMRFRAQGGTMSEQDAVQRMLKDGGNKPKATEYMLQQVIFVIPAAERNAILGKRKREAEAMRARFSGCDTTRQFAKGLIDVTVRDLGRVLAPELPPEWADQIKSTKTGGATGVRETERGVEFIGICSAKEVSDDRVAKMVFQSEGGDKNQADEMDKRYVEELRAKANIVQR